MISVCGADNLVDQTEPLSDSMPSIAVTSNNLENKLTHEITGLL